jgi:hypothetical protein
LSGCRHNARELTLIGSIGHGSISLDKSPSCGRGLGLVCLDEPGFTALGLDEGDGFFATIHVDVRNDNSA